MKLPKLHFKNLEFGFSTFEKVGELIVEIYTTKELVLSNVEYCKLDKESLYLMDYNDLTIHGRILNYHIEGFEEYNPKELHGMCLGTRTVKKIRNHNLDKSDLHDQCKKPYSGCMYKINLYYGTYHDIFYRIKKFFNKEDKDNVEYYSR